MQKPLLHLIATIALASMPFTTHADDLGIKVVVEGEIQPGVYGRVELGKDSHPDLVYTQPRVIVVEKDHHYSPVYLHVPPGHAKHWDKHCSKYNACNRPVYFIKSAEYEVDHHDAHHEKDNGKGQGKGKDKNKGKH
jgi:hypothetical protein